MIEDGPPASVTVFQHQAGAAYEGVFLVSSIYSCLHTASSMDSTEDKSRCYAPSAPPPCYACAASPWQQDDWSG